MRYGREWHLAFSVDANRLVARREAPEQLETVEDSIRDALATPLDFPPQSQAVLPGDHIVIALDSGTPAAGVILAALLVTIETVGRRHTGGNSAPR